MGEYVGEIAGYEVWWNSEDDSVWVGGEYAGDAISEDNAMEIAQDYIGS